MVQAVVEISDHANRVINIVKAKYDLRDKSAAIEQITIEYEQEVLEPELRPEFVQSIVEAKERGRFRKVKQVSELFR